MDEFISRKAAIAYIREQSEECQKAFEELGGESGIYADAYNDLAEDFYSIPAAKAVSLHDIYRVIAGHSYYHGDRILAALTCIVEGKEVNPVRPADVAPVVRCMDCANSYEDAFGRVCACGICVDCTVPDDFYCASSKPKEERYADDHD